MVEFDYKDFNYQADPDEDNYDSMSIFKVVFLGDSGVGKTNLMTRFSSNTFDMNSKPTIGVDFSMKNILMGNNLIRVQIWDTAGQERYQTFTNAYFKESHGIILVYDVTIKESFENVKKWLHMAKTHVDLNKCSVILIGNKIDLIDQRQVGCSEGEDFARQHELLFMETSAFTNEDDCVGRCFFVMLKGKFIRNPQKEPDTRN